MIRLKSFSQKSSKQSIMVFRKFLASLSNRCFKIILFLLIAFTFYIISHIAQAAQVTVCWDTAAGSVTGYKIHYGATSGDYDHSVDVGNFTSCTISGLQEGVTYYFAATAYNDNDESDYSDEIAHTIPLGNLGDTIPLPSDDAYGRIKGGDQSHIDAVNYSFSGLSGDVMLNFEAWDVDFADEVEIILNGAHIGYARFTGNESWGGMQTITLPDALVNESANNYLTINNTYNPPNKYYWGMRYVSVDVSLP